MSGTRGADAAFATTEKTVKIIVLYKKTLRKEASAMTPTL